MTTPPPNNGYPPNYGYPPPPPGYPPPPPGYPPNYGYPPWSEQPAAKRGNPLGLVALITALLGVACVPFVLTVSGVLLSMALVLGVVALCLPRRPKATSVGAIGVSVVGVVISAVLLMSMVPGDSDPAQPAENPRPSDDPTVNAAPGTRQNPLPIGETVTDPGWTVTLGTPREAGAEVAAADPSNAPPPAGMEFWIVPVRAAYTHAGGTPVYPPVEVWVEFRDAENRNFREGCGVIPDSLLAVGEMHEGDVVEANTCVAVPAGADGLWALTIAVFNDPVFFTAR